MTRTLEQVRQEEADRLARVAAMKANPAFRRWRENLRGKEESFIGTRIAPLGKSDGGWGDGAPLRLSVI